MEEMKRPGFFYLALPFAAVNGVVWGVGIIVIPLLAGNSSKAGVAFGMINLGIALGAVIWGFLSRWVQVNRLVFVSCLLSFAVWLAIALTRGKALVPLAFLFGSSAAGIFVLASVVVTQVYRKDLWDRYVSLMQASMTGGTVVGLLLTSVWAGPLVGIPLLVLGVVACIPIGRHMVGKGEGHPLHPRCLRPKMHFSELFTGYFHHRFRLRHLFHLKEGELFRLSLRWGLALLAVAPIYAIYPLLMRDAFGVGQRSSSLVYAMSTAIGVGFFVLAGRLSKRFTSTLPFNLAIILYFLTFVFMLAGYAFKVKALGVAGFVIMIFAWSFISVGMNLSVVEMMDEDRRAEALGVANAIQSLDNVAGGMMGGALVSRFGDVSIMALGAVLTLAALLTGLKMRRL